MSLICFHFPWQEGDKRWAETDPSLYSEGLGGLRQTLVFIQGVRWAETDSSLYLEGLGGLRQTLVIIQRGISQCTLPFHYFPSCLFTAQA